MGALLVLLGVGLLAAGGEILVRGALALARRVGVSPLFSGLVIVGFGTSAPELVVSVDAALSGKPDLAIGNVVGSNIGNVLLILGLCALIAPLSIRPRVLRRDAVAVVAASVLLPLLTARGALGPPQGTVLLFALCAYLAWAYRAERSDTTASAELHRAEAEELRVVPGTPWKAIGAAVAGLLLLIAGARALLVGATDLAAALGVSEAVVGLTLVAVGTSLPELSVSIVATLRGHADVAVGNVLGSNLFNVLGILGVCAWVEPLVVHSRMLALDQWVLLGSAVLLLLFLFTGRRLNRTEGGMLLVGYGAYVWVCFAW